MSEDGRPARDGRDPAAPRVLHPPERDRTTTPYGGAAAEDRHADDARSMRHKQPRHVRAPSEDVPLRPPVGCSRPLEDVPLRPPGDRTRPPEDVPHRPPRDRTRPPEDAAPLPPHRSGPPPAPGPDWGATGPRAARRAAVEARDPAPPRAAPPARSRHAAPPVPARRDAAAPPPSRGPRRIAEPRPARVRADEHGRPLTVAGRAVEAVRESWLVEDRWWTDAPLRRRYWEVVTTDGRNRVVFRDLEVGAWFSQPA